MHIKTSAALQAALGLIFRLQPRALPWAKAERPFGPQTDLTPDPRRGLRRGDASGPTGRDTGWGQFVEKGTKTGPSGRLPRESNSLFANSWPVKDRNSSVQVGAIPTEHHLG